MYHPEQVFPGETRKSLIDPKPKDEVPTQNVAYGWNHRSAKPVPYPPFLPDDVIKAVLGNAEFLQVLERLELYFKNQSIQAIFHDSPPSALLQTLDLVELAITFWEAPDNQFYVDIQLCCGEDFKFHNIMHDILDVIHGINKPSTRGPNDAAAKYEKIQKMHLFLEQLVADQGLMDSTNPTQQNPHQNLLLMHTQVVSRLYSDRASGLDSLIHATDLECTIASHAREAALMILSGKSPVAQTSEPLDQICYDIQDVLIQILVTRDLDSDEVWQNVPVFAENNVLPEDRYPPFLPSSSEMQGYSESTTMTSIHKVLTILSNSLEVLTFDGFDTRKNIHELLSSFLSRCSGVTGESLASTLVNVMMDGCHQCMAVAYLACRVLRLLSVLYPPFRKELRTNSWIQKCVEKAFQTGRVCHSLLETESLLLLRDGISAGNSGMASASI